MSSTAESTDVAFTCEGMASLDNFMPNCCSNLRFFDVSEVALSFFGNNESATTLSLVLMVLSATANTFRDVSGVAANSGLVKVFSFVSCWP